MRAGRGAGFDSLCAVWSDPEFDATERAFYYARVLENPTCRWSTYLCNAQAIDCSGTVPEGYEECCNPDVPKTIQERAWSSPIWYRPEGISRVRGAIRFHSQPERNGLSLNIDFGRTPPGLDPSTQALTIALRDDDDVFNVTIPAGTLEQVRPGRFVLNDPSGGLGGIRSLRLKQRGSGRAIFRLRSVSAGLEAADRVDHFMEVSLRSGNAVITATPLWELKSARLVTD